MAPSSHIIEQLHNIIKMSPEPSESPVGVLTSDHRDNWAKSRERLIAGHYNIVDLLFYTYMYHSVFCNEYQSLDLVKYM